MTLPTSEKRLTRSQARAGTPVAGSTTPIRSTTPSSALKSSRGFSKAGRRVLAELACNDSPIIGLLPAGTPASSKQKSGNGGPLRSRRELLANTPSHPASMTPLGESLLRSQVQLLLQKVESDVCVHLDKARVCAHSNVGSGIMASPMMLAAPTPLNTPVVFATTVDSHFVVESNALNASMDSTSQDVIDIFKGVQIHQQMLDLPSLQLIGSCTENMSSFIEPQMHNAMYAEKPKVPDVSSASNCFTVALSTTSSVDKQPLSEVSDVPSSNEIFLGKRTLHFDDVTPCKSPTAMVVADLGHLSSVREFDDDEASEWSVHVNVGSPADKQSVADLGACSTMGQCRDALLAKAAESSSIHEHLKKMQQVPSSKVDLLWDEDRERRPTYRGEGVLCEDKAAAEEEDEEEEDAAEEDDDADYSEEYYSGREEEEDEGECDYLCDMFREMRFEEGKGLPRGEGKHIRFLYEGGEDEISEAMVVRGEEEVYLGGGGASTRLKGLPAPLGRHWRFVHEEGEDEGEDARSQ